LFLDLLEEKLFNALERNIEISIEKDHLFDSVSGLERQIGHWRSDYKKLKKQYDKLKRIHSKCKNKTFFLYR
jgi:hypothetical protein